MERPAPPRTAGSRETHRFTSENGAASPAYQHVRIARQCIAARGIRLGAADGDITGPRMASSIGRHQRFGRSLCPAGTRSRGMPSPSPQRAAPKYRRLGLRRPDRTSEIVVVDTPLVRASCAAETPRSSIARPQASRIQMHSFRPVFTPRNEWKRPTGDLMRVWGMPTKSSRMIGGTAPVGHVLHFPLRSVPAAYQVERNTEGRP